jgi:hypothetical protein
VPSFHLLKLRLWLSIHRAKQQIKKLARERCPNPNIFSERAADPRHLAIFSATADAEASKMSDDRGLSKELSDTMLQAGYPAAVPFVKFRIESQETADRDYGGSWVEAIEMPQISSRSD